MFSLSFAGSPRSSSDGKSTTTATMTTIMTVGTDTTIDAKGTTIVTTTTIVAITITDELNALVTSAPLQISWATSPA